MMYLEFTTRSNTMPEGHSVRGSPPVRNSVSYARGNGSDALIMVQDRESLVGRS